MFEPEHPKKYMSGENEPGQGTSYLEDVVDDFFKRPEISSLQNETKRGKSDYDRAHAMTF